MRWAFSQDFILPEKNLGVVLSSSNTSIRPSARPQGRTIVFGRLVDEKDSQARRQKT